MNNNDLFSAQKHRESCRLSHSEPGGESGIKLKHNGTFENFPEFSLKFSMGSAGSDPLGIGWECGLAKFSI